MNIVSQNHETSNSISQNLQNFCKRFGLYKLLSRFGASKTKGISFVQVFDFLMGLVFTGKNLYRTTITGGMSMSKDTVHRFLKNAQIHWEKILQILAASVIQKLRPLTGEDRLTAIVVDDSPYYRNRSKKVELLSKQFDHVFKKFFMGFRMLTLGFTDGNTFIPFASQLMASQNTENPTEKLMDKRTLAARRRKNAMKTMPERLYELLKTAKAMKVPARHVLFDSWFSNPITLITIKNIGYSCVAMLKKGKTKYQYDGKLLNLSEIFKRIKKRPGRSKYLASVSVSVVHSETKQTTEAKIVFVRDRKNRKKWCALISTDVLLSEEEIIQLYGKRWDIEVFFKMCKSYLKLAKEFEGRSYDMMTAHTSIVFIRYICLAWTRRESEDPRCFGELFYFFCDELQDISFKLALELLLSTLVETIHDSLFLPEEKMADLLDSFFAKLPESYSNLRKCHCES